MCVQTRDCSIVVNRVCVAPTYMCVNTYMCVCVGSQTRDYRQRFEAEITEHAKDVKALQVCVCLNKQFCVRVCVCVCVCAC